MALFSKPPAKKPDPVKTDSRATGGPRPVSAREVAAQAAGRHKAPARPANEPTGDISVTGASLMEWSAAPSAIEVAQANPGLCTVLENAALMYASGQAAPARALLEQGVATDEDTRLSPLAWLALLVLDGVRMLTANVLNQSAAARYVQRLNPKANREQW